MAKELTQVKITFYLADGEITGMAADRVMPMELIEEIAAFTSKVVVDSERTGPVELGEVVW
jgi:hypothetical protein